MIRVVFSGFHIIAIASRAPFQTALHHNAGSREWIAPLADKLVREEALKQVVRSSHCGTALLESKTEEETQCSIDRMACQPHFGHLFGGRIGCTE